MKRIEIFKPGTHTAMSGEILGFTEAQLRASAAAYDPTVHEAPIVIGHPRDDGPAYGWVKSLSFAESLQAEPDQVEPQFSEMVQAGRFKKVSVAWYRPTSPANPVPGVYYLRHVAFLGAQPPAIKGLKQVEFADADTDVIELEFGELDFGEVRAGTVQRLFRGLRDFLIGKEGLEAADRVLPDWDIQNIQDEPASVSPAFREAPAPTTIPTTQEVTDVDKQELERQQQALKDREDAIKAQEVAFSERQRKLRGDESASLVDSLVTEGKVLPKHRDGLVAFMASPEADQALEFGEGKAHVKTTGRAFIEQFLQELPKSIEYGEHGKPDGQEPSAQYGAPQGFTVDPDKARMHNQALVYQEKNKCDYVTAVLAVERGNQA